ncbi:MAG: hypothetical protein JW832_09940 [Deltaproteobacteria bacterium]|nr:hypothetical protein [Deltaproteobacteria bacterium]
MRNNKFIDMGSVLVMAITFILFTAALFTKGFTHDLFLEAGVFLVSVKLMIMVYRNGRASREIDQRLDALTALLQRLEQKNI